MRMIRATCSASIQLVAALVLPVATSSAQDVRALSPGLTYDGAVVGTARGGLQTGTAYVGNLHLKLTATGDALGWPGLSGFVDLLTIHGSRPSQFVGDVQGVSSIEGATGTHVEELWVQQNFKASGLSLLVGLYDVNSEFYRVQAAGLFLNSAFGIGTEFAQGGVEGPSIFPRTAAGVRLAMKPTRGSVIRLALSNGAPLVRLDGSRALFRNGDGLLGVAEVALLSRPGDAPRVPTGARNRIGRFSSLAPYGDKLAIGSWHFTGRFPVIEALDSALQSRTRPGTSGAYIIGEYALMRGHPDATKRVASFAQLGVADSRTNRLASHVAAGLVGSGWGFLKNADQVGVSITVRQEWLALRSRAVGERHSLLRTLKRP